MRLSSLFLAVAFTLAIFGGMLLVLGVRFERPLPAQGAALYDPNNEVVLSGKVQEVREFACPVNEGEVGTHLTVMTANGIVQVHLAPVRIMRGQNLIFTPGDEIQVVGSKLRFHGKKDVIAREVTRGQETLVFRDRAGALMMVQ
jgi:hypothetical protein